MFRPVALFIGLRYTRAKRRNHFISFISLTSMLGIALGVTVLITVLSVMNGFDKEIRQRIFGMARQVTVSTVSGTLSNWQMLAKQLSNYPGVTGVAPFISGQGMLAHAGQVHPVAVVGILPKQEAAVADLANHMTVGSLADLNKTRFGIVIGQTIADNLGLTVGDKVTLITPTASITPAGLIPRFKALTIVGIFKLGNGFAFDSSFSFMNLFDAQKLFQIGHAVSGLRLKVVDLYAAPRIAQGLMDKLGGLYLVNNWTQEYGSYFDAIKLEKTMIFLMLLLIVAVAAFNLVSTLVMVVTDKKADIAILRTFGATPGLIMAIFMVQGVVIGVAGTLLGLIGGITLATHVTEIVALIEQIFHTQLLSSDVYVVNYLPSQLLASDIIKVCSLALLMSILATLYPAWRAARTQPAEALRYE